MNLLPERQIQAAGMNFGKVERKNHGAVQPDTSFAAYSSKKIKGDFNMIPTKKLITSIAVVASLTLAGTSFAMMGGGGNHGSYNNYGYHGYSRNHDRYNSMDFSFGYGRYNSNHGARYRGYYDNNHMRDISGGNHSYYGDDHMGYYDDHMGYYNGGRGANSHNNSRQYLRYRYRY